MKKIYLFLLGAIMIWSCTEDDSKIMVSGGTPPVLSLSSAIDSLTLDKDLESETALTFTWTAADFGVPTSINYILEMDATTAFGNAIKIAETTALGMDVSHGVLNNALLNAEYAFDEAHTIFFRVRATLGTENVQQAVSQTPITLAATPYNDIPVFNSDIGIIGTASPGMWDFDTDMEDLGGGNYRLEIELAEGEAKFRQDDDWASNWGATDFPAGVGEQNGDNIPIPAGGVYLVTFNKNTGAYSFELKGAGPTISLIGLAVADWDTDVALFPQDDGTYSRTVDFVEGEFKFRQDNDWAVNWGAVEGQTNIDENSSGTAEFNSPNNFTTSGGQYVVTFNPETGAYSFETAIQSIGIIGSATPNGWDADSTMSKVSDGVYEIFMNLDSGEVKFRANDAWTISWGAEAAQEEAAAFPSGALVQPGENIKVNEGFYKITIDINNLTYEFALAYESIGIIGSATPGGWDADTDMTEVSEGVYEVTVSLDSGEVKFRANDGWDISWGIDATPAMADDFPSGALEMPGQNIRINEGLYKVTIDIINLTYEFSPAFESIGIIGTATPGGWDTDTDMRKVDDSTYVIVAILQDGEMKLRANDAWEISWGSAAFPDGGTAVNPGDNIAVTGGLYKIIFNPINLNIQFIETTIGIIGSATPGGWDNDTDMEIGTGDNALKLVGTFDLTADEAKFREGDDWGVNWGATTFPSGTATQGGENIPVAEAGNYTVVFDPVSGEYSFTKN